MMDDRFDGLVKETAREYNAPPQTPRELMWARIEAVRGERARRRERLRILHSAWTRWGVGIAAALAIGLGIARVTAWHGSGPAPIAIAPEERVPAVDATLAYRMAATEHLSRAEAFLTSFRAEPLVAESGAGFWAAASDLLTSTRLLLDSPAAQDATVRTLLEDLELVLVQISQITDRPGVSETELANEGLERGGLLLRLRTAIPAGL